MSGKRLMKVVISVIWYAAMRVGYTVREMIGCSRPWMNIIYYHSVPDDAVSRFEWQMNYLASHYVVVPANYRGRLERRKRYVAITFDDAFCSVSRNAMPILRAIGMPASIFVPTGYIGRQPKWAMEGGTGEVVMDEDELRSASDAAICLGSHTVDHPRLSQLPASDVLKQLMDSKESLERVVDRKIDTLAFPYGDFVSDTVILCEQAGYSTVYSVLPERIDPERSGILRGRTAVEPSDTPFEFRLKASGAYSWMRYVTLTKRIAKCRRGAS